MPFQSQVHGLKHKWGGKYGAAVLHSAGKQEVKLMSQYRK